MINQTNFQTEQKRHSRLGIVSTVIGLLLPVLLVFFIMMVISVDAKKNTLGNDIIAGGLIITLTFPVVHLIAMILGIIGIRFKDTRKLFPVIGAILNAVLMLVGIGIFYLALQLFSSAIAFR